MKRSIEYTLIRSKRKTLAIYIFKGKVEVRAPLKHPKADIDKFLASKESWIIEKLIASAQREKRKEEFVLNYNSVLQYCGKRYPIYAREGKHIGFDDSGFYMPPNLTVEEIKGNCIKIYRTLAKKDLAEKIHKYSRIMGVAPIAVKINGATTRWGSCSAKKSINFSWRLIMANDDIIDYVVIHELAHIVEMNHSKRFWAVIENVIPDYKERKIQLKRFQYQIENEDW